MRRVRLLELILIGGAAIPGVDLGCFGGPTMSGASAEGRRREAGGGWQGAGRGRLGAPTGGPAGTRGGANGVGGGTRNKNVFVLPFGLVPNCFSSFIEKQFGTRPKGSFC